MANKWNPLNKIIGRKKDQVNDRLSPEAYKKFSEVMKIAEETLNLDKKVSVDDVKSKKPTWNRLNKIIERKKDKLDFVQKSNENSVVEELRNLKSKLQDLKRNAELVGKLCKSYPSKYNEKSVEILQEKFNNVKNAARIVNCSLKNKVSPMNVLENFLTDLSEEQRILRTDINKLRRENRDLFLKRDISKQDREEIRKINNSTIKEKEKQIESKNIEMKKLVTKKGLMGKIRELIQELEVDKKNNLNKLKQKVAKLEFAVRSIEKGKAPAPPVQTNMVEQQSKTTPLSPKDYIQNLATLAGYVGEAGVYEDAKRYLGEVIESVKGFYVTDSNDLNKMQRSLSKPNITKQECTNVINMLKDKIVNNDIKPKLSEENTYGKYITKVIENRTNNVERCI